MTVESFDPATATPANGVSRREIIKSVIASGAVVSAGSILGLSGCSPGETPAAATSAGGVERLISLNVNGKVRRVDVMPQETLANTLRYKLGLTGTKLGCDRAECGACTVLIDGVATNSCLVPVCQVQGTELTTVEGLAKDDRLAAVQQAFITHGAAQCGICTPGFLVTAHAFLKNNPRPTRMEVREGLAGNLCRCTGYQKIIDAVQVALAEGGRE